jgi:hypothetical protein
MSRTEWEQIGGYFKACSKSQTVTHRLSKNKQLYVYTYIFIYIYIYIYIYAYMYIYVCLYIALLKPCVSVGLYVCIHTYVYVMSACLFGHIVWFLIAYQNLESRRVVHIPSECVAKINIPVTLTVTNHDLFFKSRSRSRSRTIYFSNISRRKMNNSSQPSFTQHPSAVPTLLIRQSSASRQVCQLAYSFRMRC